MKRYLISLSPIMVTVIFLLSPGFASAAPACGSTITANTTLDANMSCPTGNGLVIGASNITLDCAGHSITGAGASGSNGVVATTKSGVTVKNCSIANFLNGVNFNASPNATLNNISVTGTGSSATGFGVGMFSGSNNSNLNKISVSGYNGTGGKGVWMSSSNGITLGDLSLNGNSTGLNITSGTMPVFQGVNSITGNTNGISLFSVTGYILDGSLATINVDDNQNAAISISSNSSGNTIKNFTIHNAHGHSAAISASLVTGLTLENISVTAPATASTDPFSIGISVGNATTTVLKNITVTGFTCSDCRGVNLGSVKDTTLENVSSTGNHTGFQQWAYEGPKFLGVNDFSNNLTYGMFFGAIPNYTLDGSQVTIKLDNNQKMAISLGALGGVGSDNSSIKNFSITNTGIVSGWCGIGVSGSSNVLVENASVSATAAAGNGFCAQGSATNPTFRNISATGYTNSGRGLLLNTGTSGAKLDGVTLTGNAYGLYVIGNTNGPTFVGANTINNNSTYGIRFDTTPNYILDGSQANINLDNNPLYALYLSNSNNSTFKNFTINKTGGSNSIGVSGSTGVTLENLTINGNNSTSDGILISNGSANAALRNVSVSGFKSGTSRGINIVSSNNPTIQNATASANGSVGLSLNTVVGATFLGTNSFIGNTGVGLNFSNADNVTVSGVTAENNATGILADSASTGNTFGTVSSGNRFCGNTSKDATDNDNNSWINNQCATSSGHASCSSACIVVDTTAPETSITSAVDGNGHSVINNGVTNSNSIALTFDGSDDIGVTDFECSIDLLGSSACFSPQSYAGLSEVMHTFSVRALDAAGNADQTPAAMSWLVDSTNPVSTNTLNPVSPNGENGWYTTDVTYSVTGSDNSGSGISATYVCVDKTNSCDPVVVNGPASGTVANEGSNYIRYQSKDAAGNLEPVKVSLVKIDKTNPSASLDSLTQNDGDGLINLVWHSSDTVSDVASVEVYRGTDLVTTSMNSNGSYVDDRSNVSNDGHSFTYTVRVKDFAGHIITSSSQSTTVDLLPPTVPAVIPLSAFVNTQNVVVQWRRGVDTVSGTALYSLFRDNFITAYTTVTENDPNGQNITELRSYTDSSVTNGETHAYRASATDLANPPHTSNQSDSAVTTIDTVKPATTESQYPATANGQNDWYVSPVGITLNCADATSGCAQSSVSVDGAQAVPYTGTFLISTDGVHNITFSSTDNAGNQEMSQTVVVKYDHSAPVITNNTLPTSTTNANFSVSGVVSDSTSGPATIVIDDIPTTLGANGSFSQAVPLVEGQNIITEVATDAAGNSTTQIVSIFYDSDSDGILGTDACPTVAGRAEYQGCPFADKTIVTLHIDDQAKSGVCGLNKNGKPNPTCKNPLQGVVVRVFDREDPNFIAAYGSKRPKKADLDLVFESAVGKIGQCTTDSTGTCIAGEDHPGKFLVITKYVDGSNTVYQGKFKNFKNKELSSREEGDDDDMDDDNYTSHKDYTILTKNLRLLKTIKSNGDIRYEGAQLTMIPGSELDIISPESTIWEAGTELYPFIMTSAEDWTVDVCLQVPVGYKINSIQDQDGNIVSDNECMQAFVAGETKVIYFTVTDVGSPEPAFGLTLTTKHQGKITEIKKTIEGVRRATKKRTDLVARQKIASIKKSIQNDKKQDKMKNRIDLLKRKTALMHGLVSPTSITSSLAFTRVLKVGSEGQDVTVLQKTLNKLNFTVASQGPGSPGNETTVYGYRTAMAVKKFQEANFDSILKPIGLTKGTGIFGNLSAVVMVKYLK